MRSHQPKLSRCADHTVRWLLAAHRPAVGRSRRTAFTLIELLLAVMIFGIVLLAINTVFYSALHLRNRTADLMDTSQSVEQALAFIRRDFQGALPPGGVMVQWFKIGPVSAQGVAGTSSTTSTTGTSRRGVTSTGVGDALSTGATGGGMQTPGIQFFTTTGIINDTEPWGDIQRITYQLQAPTDRRAFGKDLVRSINRNLLATTIEEPVEQRLLNNIDTMDIDCFTGTQWQTTWDTTLSDVGLPTAVRIRIQFASENLADARNRQPLEMIFPLTVQAVTNQTQSTGGMGGMQ